MSHHTSLYVKYSGTSINIPPVQSRFELSLGKASSDAAGGGYISQPPSITSGVLLRSSVQGPNTQKHVSPTYLSAVHVTAVKTTYFIESVYSKLRLS